MEDRVRVSTGTRWEERYGYSRAIRVGSHVFVAGTLAIDEHGKIVGAGSGYRQAGYIFEKIDRALAEAGATRGHVVRTRMYVTDIGAQDDVGRAHGEYFGDVRPAATMIEVRRLADPDALVEIEAEAVL